MDQSNGYERCAEEFMRARDPRGGVAAVLDWSRALPPRSSVLDLGCGHGVPVSQALIGAGFDVYGVDASPKLIAAFRARFPGAHTDCAPVEESEFFGRAFEGVVASGLMFLLRPAVQAAVIRKVARALAPGGRFLFTAPRRAVAWRDALTGRRSVSLGSAGYERVLAAANLVLAGQVSDEGGNHYYIVLKPRSD